MQPFHLVEIHVTIHSYKPNYILYLRFILDFEKKWRLEQHLQVPVQFTEGSRCLLSTHCLHCLSRSMNLIPSFFSSRVFFSLDYTDFMTEAWDNHRDVRRTSWRTKTKCKNGKGREIRECKIPHQLEWAVPIGKEKLLLEVKFRHQK